MTLAGSSVTALGTRRSSPTVSPRVGRSFSSRMTLTVVWKCAATEATESPRTDGVVADAQALVGRELRDVRQKTSAASTGSSR